METKLNSKKFASRLQKIMEAHELSATAFASKLEVGRATISHLISGRNKPSLDFIMKVVSTFPEVDINELLYGVKKGPTLRDSRVATLEQFQSEKRVSIDEEKVSEERFRESEKKLFSKSKKQSSEKTIDRIVIFYRDGTFTNHHPDESSL